MAQYNFLNLLKPKANLGKSGFDLSQKHVFSTKPGLSVPCMALETVPGDHHEINLSSLNRTMSMNTPAFLRGKFRYDFFFVPYVQLWHPFDQFITQRDDKHSSLQYAHEYCPVVELYDMLSFIINVYKINVTNQSSIYSNFASDDFSHGAVRLLDMLGYGNYEMMFDIMDADIHNNTTNIDSFLNQYKDKYVNVFRLAAYQHIWYDYYRNKFYDTEYVEEIAGATCTMDYVECFNFDDLGCATFAQSILSSDGSYSTPSDLHLYDNYRFANLLMLRHVQWKKDMFTAALPGTQFGSVSTVEIDMSGSVTLSGSTGSDYFRWSGEGIPSSGMAGVSVISSGSSNPTGTIVNSSNQRGISHTHTLSGTSSINNSSFDVLALKRAEALQAWKQNTLRAGNMTDDAFRAHYGVEPYYYEDNNVRFLGSYEAMLQINAVQATATTGASENGKVAEQGATGTAVAKGQTIRFDTKDFGVVLCISSFVPEAEYSASMVDKANRLHEKFDFFTPEYQNIGLETLTGADYNLPFLVTAPNFVLGYLNRYWMYKTAVDKVHGQFATNAFNSGVGQQPYIVTKGSLTPWVTPRNESIVAPIGGSTPSRKKNTWYVDADVLDNILGITSDGTDLTDSLLHNVYFDIKSIRPMSVLGLPQF